MTEEILVNIEEIKEGHVFLTLHLKKKKGSNTSLYVRLSVY